MLINVNVVNVVELNPTKLEQACLLACLLAPWCRGQSKHLQEQAFIPHGDSNSGCQAGQQAPLFPEHLSSPVALFLLINEDCSVDADGHLAQEQ